MQKSVRICLIRKSEILTVSQIWQMKECQFPSINSQHYLLFSPGILSMNTHTHKETYMLECWLANWQRTLSTKRTRQACLTVSASLLTANPWHTMYDRVLDYFCIMKNKGISQESRKRKWEDKPTNPRVASLVYPVSKPTVGHVPMKWGRKGCVVQDRSKCLSRREIKVSVLIYFNNICLGFFPSSKTNTGH